MLSVGCSMFRVASAKTSNAQHRTSNIVSNCRPSVSDGDPTHWRWQEGCFDRLLRSNELLSEKWEYLRQNPIRAGLAVDPDEWLSISIL